jgi:hypothetical protein
MHPLAPHFTPVLVKTQREKPEPLEASSKPLRVQSAFAPLASAFQKGNFTGREKISHSNSLFNA